MPDPNILLWITASVADVAAVNPNVIKTPLGNGLSIFSIKGNPDFSNGSNYLPRNPSHCLILCNWVFNNFTLVEKLLVKALRRFETCVLVNNDLCEKVFSSLESPAMFG